MNKKHRALFLSLILLLAACNSPPPSPNEGELQITFAAEPAQIAPGECATLRWQVTGPHTQVIMDGHPLPDSGRKEVCPPDSMAYFIQVVTETGVEERRATVQVSKESSPSLPNAEEMPPPGEMPSPDEIPAIGIPPALNTTPPIAPNLPYLTVAGETLTLNIYHPPGEETCPVVMYIHGGGFTSGDKWEGQHWASYLLPWGYAVVSIDYRLAPRHPFPAAIADVQCAIAWIRQHADTYHLAPQHIALIGSSAGGHLAALAGMVGAPGAPSAPWQPSCNIGSNFQVQAVVSHSGPMDLQKILSTGEGHDAVLAFVGSACQPPTVCAQASPITYVSRGAPPVLLFHGTRDGIVPVINAREMATALRAANVPVTYIEMQNAGHVDPLNDTQLQTLRHFLDQYLKP